MAKATLSVITALRRTARTLEESNDYQWGHMGSCNCGFLAREITLLRKDEIHRRAMQRHGDWNEQLNDYCATSGLLMDDLISELITYGFDVDDLRHLEKLSDSKVLRLFPLPERNLRHNIKRDVITYLNRWADSLEAEQLLIYTLKEINSPEVRTIL